MAIVTTNNQYYAEIAAAIREKNGSSTLYKPSEMAAAILALKIAPPYDSTFANNDWSTIIEMCEQNKVPDTWVVGDSKTMTINGTSYRIDIIGKNHDTYATGGTAPLTFQLHDCYGSTYTMNADTNVGGWANSIMRNTHLPSILSKMPSEVQLGIKAVNKLTSAGNKSTTINTTADKLFLLSEIEVFGSLTASVSGEGSKYSYYTTTDRRIKSGTSWWLRSPYSANNYSYAYVRNTGLIGAGSSTNPYGVAFAFCF